MGATRGRTAAALSLAVALAWAAPACSQDPGSTEAFCAQVRRVPALESVLARFDEVDPDLLQEKIDKARSAYDALADAAPSRIDTETDDVVALVDEVLQSVEDHPSDPAEAAAQLRAATPEHPDAEKSRVVVATFARESCDVTLDPDLSGVTSTTIPGD